MAGYKRVPQVVGNEDSVEGGYQQVNVQVFDQVAREAQDIRKSKVNFSTYMSAGTLSAQAFQFVEDYQSFMSDGDQNRERFMKDKVQQCCGFFRCALNKIKKEEPLRYAMTVLTDLLEDGNIRDVLLSNLDLFDVVNYLVSLLKFNDKYIMLLAGLNLGRIALYGKHLYKLPHGDSVVYVAWSVQQLSALETDYLVCLTEGLKLLLRVPEYRELFYDSNGLKPLTDILSRKTNFQLQYQVCFCIWMLSFNPNIIEKMKDVYSVAKDGLTVVPGLKCKGSEGSVEETDSDMSVWCSLVVMATADTLRATTREKVRRVIFATYRNLIQKPSSGIAEHFAIQMVTYKVLLVLNILVKNTFQDDDFRDDVEFLQEHLSNSVNEMSSFDEFAAELKSKRLEWSPVHKSDKFWRENVLRLHENNYQLLKILVGILEDSSNPQCLAVACYDIGEYVRHLPRGKKILEDLGGKVQILRLIGHEDLEVKSNALLALQKVMVQNWEYLGKQLSDGK